ncbi:MAG: hypothetical protein JRH11_28390 [Deltaproteobacteria bacterium]|nr:hypothetical protein [Deltaproteobacteria bacterium]
MSKTIFTSTLLAVGASLALFACANPGDGVAPGAASEPVAEAPEALAAEDNPRLERRLSHMQERLDLTDEQVTLLRPVLEARHERGPDSREALHAELEGILTPDQLGDVEEMRGSRRGGMRRHHGPRDPAEMLARMTERLELTDAQVAELAPAMDAMHARREELRDLPREERHEAFRAMREETKALFDSVLDDEQRARLEERFGRRGFGPGPGHHRGGRRHHRGGPGGPDFEGDRPGSRADDVPF